METIVRNNIYKIRLKKKFTQEYMANQLVISQSHYSKLEKGSQKLSFEIIIKIAQILDLEVKELLNTD